MTGRALEDIARQLPQPSEGLPSARRPGGFAQKQLIRVGQTHLFSADVTDDGAYVLAVSDAEAQVRVYDARGALVSRFPVKGFTQFAGGSFAFYPGAGRPRVLAANEQGIALYDGLSGEWLSTLCDQPTFQLRLVLEKRLLIANLSDLRTQSSRLAFFEVLPEPGLVELGQLESQERIDGYDLSDDGRLLAMSTYPSNSVQLLNLSTPSLLWAVEGPKYVRPVDISPDGRLVAAGGDLLLVYDAQDASRRAELKGYGNNLHEIRFLDRDGELATTSYDGALRIVSVDKEKPALRLVQTLRHGGKANVYAIVVRNGGDEILTSSGDKTIRRFSRKAR
jgi:WD40 repeat protein